jgi:peptidoglycan L-alanyl-D-glutamate endopeptidase CwlK
MNGVHPDIKRVIIRAAAITTVPFFVNETVRSREQCMINYGKGRTGPQCAAKGIPVTYAQPKLGKVTWLIDPFNSKHCKQKDGFGHAVDLYASPYNQNQSKDATYAIAKAVLQAAKELKVALRWGKDWDRDGIYEEKGETDGPHFELV